jgi:hypothetical protein
MDKPIIISGIPEGDSGVGRLIQYLKTNNDNYYNLITLSRPNNNYTRNRLFKITDKIFFKILNFINKKRMKYRISKLKNEKLVLIHPQTIGFDLVLKLIKNNEVYLYVMDNSFFCVKSYNHLPGEFQSCIRCLKYGFQEALEHKCKPSPVKVNIRKNFEFLKGLKKYKDDVVFWTQNTNQKKLIESYFGKKVNCKVIGLKTYDMCHDDLNFSFEPFKDIKPFFDFVYHASAKEAKGLLFCLELSSKLPNKTFLIPDSLEKCSDELGKKIEERDYPNVSFKKMRWDTGLNYYVRKAKVVLNLSLWSAPIEGALIKSLKYNGVVAGLNTNFSFCEELNDDLIFKLDNNSIEKSSKSLQKLSSNEKLRKRFKEKSSEWINDFLKKNDIIEKINKGLYNHS